MNKEGPSAGCPDSPSWAQSGSVACFLKTSLRRRRRVRAPRVEDHSRVPCFISKGKAGAKTIRESKTCFALPIGRVRSRAPSTFMQYQSGCRGSLGRKIQHFFPSRIARRALEESRFRPHSGQIVGLGSPETSYRQKKQCPSTVTARGYSSRIASQMPSIESLAIRRWIKVGDSSTIVKRSVFFDLVSTALARTPRMDKP